MSRIDEVRDNFWLLPGKKPERVTVRMSDIDYLLSIADCAEFARNRILLFLNSNGEHKGLREVFKKLEKALEGEAGGDDD